MTVKVYRLAEVIAENYPPLKVYDYVILVERVTSNSFTTFGLSPHEEWRPLKQVRESLRVLDEEKLLINLQKNKQMKGIVPFIFRLQA